jgi:hypothetical protein
MMAAGSGSLLWRMAGLEDRASQHRRAVHAFDLGEVELATVPAATRALLHRVA